MCSDSICRVIVSLSVGDLLVYMSRDEKMFFGLSPWIVGGLAGAPQICWHHYSGFDVVFIEEFVSRQVCSGGLCLCTIRSKCEQVMQILG